MTARAVYEASAHAAVARYHANLDEMARKPAYDRLIHDLLKCADTYAHGADHAKRADQVRAADLDAALEKLRQEHADA